MVLTKREFTAPSIRAAEINADLTSHGGRALNMINGLFDSVSALKVTKDSISFVGDGAECVIEARSRGDLLICRADKFTIYYDYADLSVRYCHRFDFASGLCVLDIGEHDYRDNPAYETLQIEADEEIYAGRYSFYFTPTLDGIWLESPGESVQLTWDDIRAGFNRKYLSDFEWYCRRFL